MAIFKFTRPYRQKSPKSPSGTLDAAIQAQRGRLLHANAMTLCALDALQASPSADARVVSTIISVRELICGAVLALDPARLADAAMTSPRKVRHG